MAGPTVAPVTTVPRGTMREVQVSVRDLMELADLYFPKRPKPERLQMELFDMAQDDGATS
jgi:hypothetical protein